MAQRRQTGRHLAGRTRSDLHVKTLDKFLEWLEREGWTREEPKGPYEVARLTHPNRTYTRWGPILVYTRSHTNAGGRPVHLTVEGTALRWYVRYRQAEYQRKERRVPVEDWPAFAQYVVDTLAQVGGWPGYRRTVLLEYTGAQGKYDGPRRVVLAAWPATWRRRVVYRVAKDGAILTGPEGFGQYTAWKQSVRERDNWPPATDRMADRT